MIDDDRDVAPGGRNVVDGLAERLDVQDLAVDRGRVRNGAVLLPETMLHYGVGS